MLWGRQAGWPLGWWQGIVTRISVARVPTILTMSHTTPDRSRPLRRRHDIMYAILNDITNDIWIQTVTALKYVTHVCLTFRWMSYTSCWNRSTASHTRRYWSGWKRSSLFITKVSEWGSHALNLSVKAADKEIMWNGEREEWCLALFKWQYSFLPIYVTSNGRHLQIVSLSVSVRYT